MSGHCTGKSLAVQDHVIGMYVWSLILQAACSGVPDLPAKGCRCRWSSAMPCACLYAHNSHEGELLEMPDAVTATPILPDTFTVQQVCCIRHLA